MKWQATHPQHHLCIYKLNQEQLKEWGEEATEIRQKINRKAETFEFYSKPKVEVEEKPKSRKSVPHSTRKSNPEGLLESQIRDRSDRYAGITKTSKKRHLKELPIATREAIVRMYLEDHIYQCDIAKYFKISPALVSKLVKES